MAPYAQPPVKNFVMPVLSACWLIVMNEKRLPVSRIHNRKARFRGLFCAWNSGFDRGGLSRPIRKMSGNRGAFLRADVPHRQKRLYLLRTHLTRMPHTPRPIVPTDEKAHPIQASLLGAETIVKVAKMLLNLVQSSFRAQNRGAGFHGSFITVFLHSV